MKAKLNVMLMLGFAIALSILFAGLADAVTLGGSIINSPQTAFHDSDVTATFNVTYDGTAATTNLNFSDSTSNIGIWKTLPPITLIEKGKTLTFSATLNVPKYSIGAINAIIKVKEDGGAKIDVSVPAITITESPSFVLTSDKSRIIAKEDIKLKIENTGNTPLSIALTSSGDFGMTITPSTINVNAGDKNENIIATPGELSGLKFGDYSVTINAKDSSKKVEQNLTLAFTKSFCKSGDTNGNLSINKIRFDSDGEDENTWKPLDSITIEVEVENNGDRNIRDVFVVLGLFDSDGKDRSGDLDFINDGEEKIDVGTIGDDSEETLTFEFKVPVDMDTGDYKLVIKAYSDDLGESRECTSESGDLDNDLYQDISVETETDEDKFIVIDNIEVNPAGDITCGDEITVTADVYNVGDEDQDQVRVVLSNSELKLNEEKIIRNLDAGDSSKVTFSFNVPNGLQDKLYILNLGAQYDYRNGVYRESSSRTAEVSLRVTGCGPAPTEKIATIAATLDSDAQAGKVYDVYYYGANSISEDARYVRVNYPDSSAATSAVIYPTIMSSKGALVSFYEPTTITLTSWDGRSNELNTLRFPDGDGFTDITFGAIGSVASGYGGFNVTCGSTVTQMNTTTVPNVGCTIGQLTYNITSSGVNETTIRLNIPGTGTGIQTPALVIFEEKDDNTRYEALVVTLDSGTTSSNGLDVSDIYRTWMPAVTSSSVNFRDTSSADSDITKEADLFGTIVSLDSNSAGHKKATISYPDEQVQVNIYVGTIASAVTGGSTGGAGTVKNLGSIAFTDAEVSTVSGMNLIVVGGSCVNSVAASLLGVASPTCGAAFTEKTSVGAGQYLIETFARTGGKVATLVAGYNAGDTTNAAKALTTKTGFFDTTAGKKYTGSTATDVTAVVASTTTGTEIA